MEIIQNFQVLMTPSVMSYLKIIYILVASPDIMYNIWRVGVLSAMSTIMTQKSICHSPDSLASHSVPIPAPNYINLRPSHCSAR